MDGPGRTDAWMGRGIDTCKESRMPGEMDGRIYGGQEDEWEIMRESNMRIDKTTRACCGLNISA